MDEHTLVAAEQDIARPDQVGRTAPRLFQLGVVLHDT